MAQRFFDTSAAVKHYRAELGTPKVDAFLSDAGSVHFLSELGVVEFHSVVARLVRTGHITIAEFHLARRLFLGDIAAGLWQIADDRGPLSSGPASASNSCPDGESPHPRRPPDRRRPAVAQ